MIHPIHLLSTPATNTTDIATHHTNPQNLSMDRFLRTGLEHLPDDHFTQTESSCPICKEATIYDETGSNTAGTETTNADGSPQSPMSINNFDHNTTFPVVVKITQCRGDHIFHYACLIGWLEILGAQQGTCPLDRDVLYSAEPHVRASDLHPAVFELFRGSAMGGLDLYINTDRIPVQLSVAGNPGHDVVRIIRGEGGLRVVPAHVDQIQEGIHDNEAIFSATLREAVLQYVSEFGRQDTAREVGEEELVDEAVDGHEDD
ncbi:hypothetical protein P154DRAFT_151408 [Amniculicola lignicola CBS 123094]|uniref:RING-type domain-containing protein n=1 Tax=Amniculicola lignicola CBS 123094 TaxID=1392246 RepID=A0A6A5WKV9_9PLEO|nr:hypothetical protein P154DRAFT_151408 [Amniculicola lignicola CBS 123094]